MIANHYLKSAFEQSRVERNIDLVLPTLLAAQLHIVAKHIPNEAKPVFFLQRSPNAERFCITASESEARLAGMSNVSLIQMTGAELLHTMNPAYEIVLVYEEGGDYLTREQLSWLRGLLSP